MPGRGARLTLTTVAARAAMGLALGLLAVLLVLPLLALVLRVPLASLAGQLQQPVVVQALILSVEASLAATAVMVLLGLPAAYLLATRAFPGKKGVEVLLDLPMVLPPTVGGLALLLAFGRAGLAGRVLQLFGLSIPFTTLAVVIAQVFMAIPLLIGAARAGFGLVDPRVREVAATLGAREGYVFWRVMLPLSLPSVVAGAAMACARALGEFGATITFAGNLPGVTQTMSLAVYLELQRNLDTAITLSVLLLLLSFGLLLALRMARPGGPR
jgi:molybdate transport system permease protein